MLSTSSPASQSSTLSPERLGSLQGIILATEYRNPFSQEHNERVGQLSALIAQQLGLSNNDVELIYRAAPLHDIGTIAIPDDILLKPGQLTPDEYEIVKTHVSIGANMLWQGQSDLMKTAQLIIKTHHERFDGSGYPEGLVKYDIPLTGQIVAVADVFDALTHDQAYRKALPTEEALKTIQGQSGKSFDPQVVTALTEVTQQTRERRRSRRVKGDVLMKGQLGHITLFDLLSLLSQNDSSGKLHVYTGFSEGLVVFYHGCAVHAELDNFWGEKAIFELFSKTERRPNSKFLLEAWQPEKLAEKHISLKRSVKELLFEAAVQLDQGTSTVVIDRG